MKNFYVYELIDPRTDKPFYVGKGAGDRISNYFQKFPKVNEFTRTVLEEIALSGNVLEIRYVSESLSESQAVSLERELIKLYGRQVKDAGGTLTNLKSSDHERIDKKRNIGSRYTTIQVTKEMNDSIKKFCKEQGLVTSAITEKLWNNYISSSASGSVLV